MCAGNMVTIFDIDAMEAIRSRNAVQPHCMKLFRNALFKKSMSWTDALAKLPDEARMDFRRNIDFECLDLVERHDSEIDGASKIIFRTHDGHLIESVVLRPKSGRTSICISAQVGCACGCDFCATGMMGLTRDLTTAEILDQVLQANRMVKSEDRSIRNVVFMGMGEPLLNLSHVCEAVSFLKNPQFFDLAESRITVSTVGVPSAMEQFVELFPKVQLALSLHSARQSVREELMPTAKKYPLEQLRKMLEIVSSRGKVMIEYLMLYGVNDRTEDLQALIEFLQGLSVHINIIPFNEYEGCSLRGTKPMDRKQFADRLKDAGFSTTLRYSMGSDIAAACGQLVQDKKRI